MTLRHIYNHILNFKQSKNNNITGSKLYEDYDYDQEPTPPQTFIKSKVQNKIIHDLSSIKQRTKNNNNIKKSQNVKLNVIQHDNSITKHQNNQSRNQKQVHYDNEESQLFVPQRKKYIDINTNRNRKKDKFRNSSTITPKQTIKRTNSVISQRKTQNLIPSKKKQIQYVHNNHTIDIARLRRLQKEQKQQQLVLKNRLNFISIDNQRQKQKIQLVKKILKSTFSKKLVIKIKINFSQDQNAKFLSRYERKIHQDLNNQNAKIIKKYQFLDSNN